jgi:TPR repeat protein
MSEPSAKPGLSRRLMLGLLAFTPMRLPFLSRLAQQVASKAVQGTFRPDDLFAPTAIAGDLERARGGDLASTIRAGFKYYSGMAGHMDVLRARSYFLVASHVSPAGAAWLGYVDVCIHHGSGAAVRKRASFKGLVSAAQAGDPVAQTLLGRVYERGLAGYKPRPDKAQQLYVSAAPQFSLAKTFWGKLLVNQQQYTQALELFQAAAKAGDTAAIADLHSRSKHPDKMASQMNRWLRLAGERGDRTALYLHGVQHQKGSPGFSADPKRGLSLLHSAAVRGHQQAQLAVSDAWAKGNGGGSHAAGFVTQVPRSTGCQTTWRSPSPAVAELY